MRPATTTRTPTAGRQRPGGRFARPRTTHTLVFTVATRRPSYVVAKGGITSSDVATRALGIDRAWIRGSLLPGIVSLWEPVSGPAQGLPYVVFAGNVGGETSLADVIERLETA